MAIWGYWRTIDPILSRQRTAALVAEGSRVRSDLRVTRSREPLLTEIDLNSPSAWMVSVMATPLSFTNSTAWGAQWSKCLFRSTVLIERGVAIKTLDGRLDTASMPEELVKLVVGVMGYAAEMEHQGIKKRTALKV